MKKYLLTTLAVAAAAFLVVCGGKGDDKWRDFNMSDEEFRKFAADIDAALSGVGKRAVPAPAAPAPDANPDADSIDETTTPYEATWMELTKEGDSYVVYNYLDYDATPGTDDEKYRTPTIIRVRGNRLTYQYYHEPEFTYLFDTVDRIDNEVYSFRMTGFNYSFLIDSLGFEKSKSTYLFQWIDKRKHIAKWIQSYDHYGKNVITDSSSIYIDSVYNKYQIVNYVWKKHPCDAGER